jgi:hypothetical protein
MADGDIDAEILEIDAFIDDDWHPPGMEVVATSGRIVGNLGDRGVGRKEPSRT